MGLLTLRGFDSGRRNWAVEALNYKKLSDLSLEYSTKLINASSEEEFNTVWDSFMSEAESLDEANVEKIITENYQKKLKLWGMK